MIEAKIKDPVVKMGKIIRTVRERTNRHLADIAIASGISTSMLSQIERGLVSPSIDTLINVCAALDMDVAELFGRMAGNETVRVHKNGQRLSTQKNGIRYEQLVVSPDPAHPAELFLIVLTPGAQAGMGGKGHDGVEMGYVIAGSATLEVNGQFFALDVQDSVSFAARLPHALKNTGAETFRALWSVLPPHTDYLDINDEPA